MVLRQHLIWQSGNLRQLSAEEKEFTKVATVLREDFYMDDMYLVRERPV